MTKRERIERECCWSRMISYAVLRHRKPAEATKREWHQIQTYLTVVKVFSR